MQASAERSSQAYDRPLTLVSSFNYLGNVLIPPDNDWTSVVGILRISRKKWARMSRILGREGANVQVSGALFKAVDQAVLLFGSNTWVMNPHMGWDIGGVSIWWPAISQESKCGISGTEVGITPLWRNR